MDKVKILVVDDESRMRKLVRDFLIRDNFDVLEAADGEEALDIFYRDKEISLIILDIMMPKINGWDVCREIRETSKIPRRRLLFPASLSLSSRSCVTYVDLSLESSLNLSGIVPELLFDLCLELLHRINIGQAF